MKNRIELVKEWLLKAEHDLKAAQKLLNSEENLNDIVCFHCQQAAEKYLKAYMVYLGIRPPKTHEIGYLITMIEEKDNKIASLKERADILTDYAVEVRYPEDFFMPSDEETKEVLEITLEIKRYVEEQVKAK